MTLIEAAANTSKQVPSVLLAWRQATRKHITLRQKLLIGDSLWSGTAINALQPILQAS